MNPIIFRQGICDPHVHIFNDRVYLYATHDSPGYEEGFHMEDWQIWSSENLIEWKQETVIHPEDFYCGALDQCWAVDAAYKNGKYYWYFSTGDWGVGVGVADDPAGPFTDVLGKPLVDYRVEPVNFPKWDPCVFQDDDGSAYLIVGECRLPAPCNCYFIARLNEDMISLAEPLRAIEYIGNPCPEDKPSVHKYGGRYYLTHSSYYAISDNVYGPYRYVGNTGCNIDHGSFFSYHNQTYFASGGMDNPNRYLRASYLASCHYHADGRISIDQKIMEYGCGQYDAAWEKIEAEWYFSASRECKTERTDGSFAVKLNRGEMVCFPNIANIEKNTKMQFCGSSFAPDKSAVIEIRENSVDGAILGTCVIGSAAPSSETGIYSCELTCGWGTRSLCFYAKDPVVLDWFSFDNGKKRSTAEPVYSFAGRGAAKIYDPDASCHRVLGNMELKGASLQGFLDGGAGGSGEIVIPYFCRDEAVELELYINDVYQNTIEFPVNGRSFLGVDPSQVRVPVEVRPGVNKVCVQSERYQYGRLAIDHITLEMNKTFCQVYAAANGTLTPWGNGCWDGLPQRENDYFAFSGRVVKYLGKPGYSVAVTGVNGGEGGTFGLEIRYSRGEEGNSCYELEVNGEIQAKLQFENTGDFSMRSTKTLQVPVSLTAGSDNMICLRKTGSEDKGVFVDSFAVVYQTYSIL